MFISENTSPELYWLPNFIPHEKASVLGGNVVAERFFLIRHEDWSKNGKSGSATLAFNLFFLFIHLLLNMSHTEVGVFNFGMHLFWVCFL